MVTERAKVGVEDEVGLVAFAREEAIHPLKGESGEEKFIVFSALCFASPAACCWCRVSCCLFLEMKSFCFDEIQPLQVTPG